MSIGILSPWWLLGLAAGAVPVVVHLLMRERPRRYVFPPLRFLLETAPRGVADVRFRHLLLLLLRVGALAALVLALARPEISGSFAVTGPARASSVFVIDDTLSMNYMSADATNLERAKEAALKRLRSFAPGSEIAVITVCYPEGTFSPDLSVVRNNISSVRSTRRGRNVWPAVRKAFDLLTEINVDYAEVYLFTDMARRSWEGFPRGNVGEENWPFFVIDVVPDDPVNAAITGVRVARRRVGASTPAAVEAEVSSFGLVGEFPVELYVDGVKVDQKKIRLEGTSRKSVGFTFVVDEPGAHQGSVELAAVDPLAADNSRYFTFSVGDLPRVLVVDGDPKPDSSDEVFFLKAALNPFEEQGAGLFEFDVATTEEMVGAEVAPYDAVVLANVWGLDDSALAALDRFVLGGGGMLVFTGDRFEPRNYDTGPANELMKGFESGALGDWAQVEVSMYNVIDRTSISENAQVLAAFTDGAAAIVDAAYGRGRVIFVATAADADWSNLPSSIVYFTFVNEALKYLHPGSDLPDEALVGEVPAIRVTDDDIGAAVFVRGPLDSERRPIGEIVSAVPPGFDTELPANYCVLLEKGLSIREEWTSVNVNPAEADTRKIPDKDVENLRPNTIVAAGEAGGQIYRRVGTRRTGLDLTPVFIVMAAALFVAESFLSNRFYRT